MLIIVLNLIKVCHKVFEILLQIFPYTNKNGLQLGLKGEKEVEKIISTRLKKEVLTIQLQLLQLELIPKYRVLYSMLEPLN